jgi:hypothetical protein
MVLAPSFFAFAPEHREEPDEVEFAPLQHRLRDLRVEEVEPFAA